MLFDKHFTGKSDTGDYIFSANAGLQAFIDGLEDVPPFQFMNGTRRVNIIFDSNILSNKEATDYLEKEIEIGYMEVTNTPNDQWFDVNVYLFNCAIMKERIQLTLDQIVRWTIAHEFGHIAFLLSEPNAYEQPMELHEQYANNFAANVMGFELRWR